MECADTSVGMTTVCLFVAGLSLTVIAPATVGPGSVGIASSGPPRPHRCPGDDITVLMARDAIYLMLGMP